MIVHQDEWLTLLQGDCRAVMAEMEPDSVQSVITSPPYFGLRDYGLPSSVWGGDPEHEHSWELAVTSGKESWVGKTRWNHAVNGQGEVREIDTTRERVGMGTFCPCGAWCGTLGLEPSPELYVEHMVEVFRAVRRVLRPDGTVWLNLGDSYADRANRRSDGESYRADRADVVPGKRNTIGGAYNLKAKDRMMMPARVAIALQADGWWLRDEIVWHKPNPMPSSVGDRSTPAHEMVYMLAKRRHYYFDADAIREKGTEQSPRSLSFERETKEALVPGQRHRQHRVGREKVPGGWEVAPGGHHAPHRTGRTEATYRDKTAATPRIEGWSDRQTHSPRQAPQPGEPNAFHALGRNKRSVWTIPTQPFPDAHFATFPEALVEPMILAGTSARGACVECGAPWIRETAATYDPKGRTTNGPRSLEQRHETPGFAQRLEKTVTTTGWRPGCDHEAEVRPCVVLDLFGGSGTVALVAQRLGRRAVLIDLSAEYLAQSIERIAGGRSSGEGPAIDMPVPFADDGLWAEA